MTAACTSACRALSGWNGTAGSWTSGRGCTGQLLAILVVEARHVVPGPGPGLLTCFWRDDPPTAAMASVQAYISQLRRVLEPARPARAPARVLVTQDPGYLLQAEDDDVDALRFLALVRQAHGRGRPARGRGHPAGEGDGAVARRSAARVRGPKRGRCRSWPASPGGGSRRGGPGGARGWP